MNWVRSTLKYLGLVSSSDEQPLKDDFHSRSEEDVITKKSDIITTIKSFTEKYPISSGNGKTETLNTECTRPTDCATADASDSSDHNEAVPKDNTVINSDMDNINLLEDTSNEINLSVDPQETSTSELNKSDKKKKKGMKKVRKRVTWAVRRSWKWLKRGWSGYAPGVASGMMYCTNAPATLFNIHSK